MYLFSVTCWVPDTRAPHAQKHISWGISEGISGKKPLEARETAVIRTENGSIFRKGPGLSAHRVDHRRQHIGTRREGVPDELRGGLVPFHWKGLKRV